jgi:RimJ/RimL family protein N-acetyltransferase
MTPTVRAFRPEDAEAVARVRRDAVPYMVCTAASVLHQAASAPDAVCSRLFVAEDGGGDVIGCVDAGLRYESPEPGQAFQHTAVRPEARGRGAGRALVAAAEAYLAGLGARRVHSWAAEDGRSLRVAERLGYTRSRRARFLGLDLRTAPLPPAPAGLPAGVGLRMATDFADDVRPLYEADTECVEDEPGDVTAGRVPLPDWLKLTWRRPEFDPVLSSVAVVHGEVAAYTEAHTDGVSRYWSGMTGTRRAFRGRGLATLVKADSLRRAHAAGLTHAFTGNDAENAPMLAVNRRLGYTLAATERRCWKDLAAG